MSKILELIEDSYIYYYITEIPGNIRCFYHKYLGRRHHYINTRLTPSCWYDTDHRLLHGMMSLLKEFVEEEKPFEHVDYDENEKSRWAASEIKAIYGWWENYKNRQEEIEKASEEWYNARIDKTLDKVNDLQQKNGWVTSDLGPITEEENRLYHILKELEAKLLQEEEEYLIRLIKIRSYLWV